MTRRALVLVGLALYTTACEHGVTLRGSITVPIEVQQAFSVERPGLVRISASIPKTSVLDYQLAVLCQPTSEPLVLPFSHYGFGCAKEGVVRVDALPARSGGRLPCGVQQTPWSAPLEGTVVATGSDTVFAGATGSFGCSSGADSVEIVLSLVR